MPEVGFQERTSLTGAGSRGREASPDSVIFNLESNFFSLFSSASASVDRCSFTSDAHDHDSVPSEISLYLVGPDHGDRHESSSDPDRNKRTGHNKKHSRFLRKGEKAKVEKEDSDADFEDESPPLDSARSSFSLALKECQDRRSRSESLSEKLDRRRPASLDLNNVTAAYSSSPRLATLKKSSVVASRKCGMFPSPGTPNYRQASIGMQKGWSSERVPSHTSANRRHAANAALLPFNNGRSTLPSKWEDAERWIFSPVSGDGVARPSFQPPQRRPKSKSGPLGQPGIAYYSMYSPATPMFYGGNVAASPFSAGVIAADGLAIHSNGNAGVPGGTEPFIARSVSVHGYSEMLSQSSLPGLQDEKLDRLKDTGTDISLGVSRRDMATQMSPQGSSHSSPHRRLSFSASTPYSPPIVQLHSQPSSKMEVRDVPVDERVTVTSWSKKHRARLPGKSSANVDDWKKKGVGTQPSMLDIKSISRSKREEAKITAWENLQKAKAEAAIRKLEMKLEKKRSSSMDKIMNKLRSAQKRAQVMRSSVLASQANQVTRTSHKALPFCRTRQIGSLSGCFTCHAF
ncbi:hypothetical protein I3843_16G044200 [Carya illinoinensis]|nr:hypothetical protein I3760_16G043200 [Carya illinoinensis]KAG2663658.1 hypothetical protein I3760_16G043200 [Carya illinoinensis]KAG2663659.1 hypothetical protein I3760_16G043200 [Carya illinoinensis]KAG7941450.1 hypothetical protein I3843_16G044200 [Carya illinoinensis]KAG7941451.1 hypothetical protein I3843_16G044200 [Carya illinoinensis]